MRILILGGCGFLGSHLARALVASGHQVRVFDRPEAVPCLPLPSGSETVAGDFADAVRVEQALTGCDAVFHLISTTLPKTSNDNPVFDLESNLVGTVRMLDSARRQGIGKIVFVSSGGTVYGIPQETPIPESHPTDPLCSYGIGKLAIEKYLRLFRHLYGLSYSVLRIANPYGEGQPPTRTQGAIAVFSYKAMRGEAIDVWGDGSVIRDYVYVGDVADAFLRALAYDGEPRVFNIGSGSGHSLNEILDAIERAADRRVKRNYLSARSFDVPVNVLDISRARTYLDWAPRVSLSEGLARTLAWLHTFEPAFLEAVPDA